MSVSMIIKPLSVKGLLGSMIIKPLAVKGLSGSMIIKPLLVEGVTVRVCQTFKSRNFFNKGYKLSNNVNYLQIL